jgi:hypothetical protein
VKRQRAMIAGLSVVGGMLVAGCQPAAHTLSDAARTALADSVKQHVAGMFAQLAHPNADSILAGYDSTGFVWGRSGSLVSYDSVASGVRRTWQNGASALIGTNDVNVRVLGPDEAVYSAIISGSYHSSTGEDRPVRAAITLVLDREGPAWRVVAGHESVPPNAMAHEADAPPADTAKPAAKGKKK